MKITRRHLLEAGFVAAGAAAAGAAFPYIIRGRSRPSIVLIVADAMRADRLGLKRLVNGSGKSITPNLDHMVRDGISFDMAIAPSSWTRISMPAILYNASPLDVGYFGGRNLRVQDTGASVVGRLAASGWRRLSVNGSRAMDMDVVRALFDTFVAVKVPRRASYIAGVPRDRTKSSQRANEEVAVLLKALRSRQFLLYVHYMDTHEPYHCPGNRLSEIGARYDGEIYTRVVKADFLKGLKTFRHFKCEVPIQEAVLRLKDHYDAAVLNVDDSVRQLIGMLDDNGLLDNALVIFTADHGEEFADNRETAPDVGHCSNLSQEQIRVPLVLWAGRGRCAPASVPQPVSSSRVINECMLAHSKGVSIDEAVAGLVRAREPIISVLNYPEAPPYNAFNGFSYISGNIKVTGAFGGKGDVAGLKAFKIGAREGVAALDMSAVPVALAGSVERALTGRGQQTFDPNAIDEKEREQLRALGYLN